jgi:heme/copper-type cytochrome/quinol oxidase subunit 1
MTDTQHQTYATHRQTVPLFHGVLFGLLVLTFIGAAVNLYESLGNSERLYSASLIFVLTFATIMLMFFSRVFALKAQDRAIRAEEQLRHYILTTKPLDPRLTLRQIIGLRFASDDEFVELARRAADENLSEDAIKQAVKTWRPDVYRV